MADSQEPTPPDPKADPQEAEPTDAVRLVRSIDLLGGEREILIEHDGQVYRLRLTRSGKLILHK